MRKDHRVHDFVRAGHREGGAPGLLGLRSRVTLGKWEKERHESWAQSPSLSYLFCHFLHGCLDFRGRVRSVWRNVVGAPQAAGREATLVGHTQIPTAA
jgi:hypothetical protein